MSKIEETWNKLNYMLKYSHKCYLIIKFNVIKSINFIN